MSVKRLVPRHFLYLLVTILAVGAGAAPASAAKAGPDCEKEARKQEADFTLPLIDTQNQLTLQPNDIVKLVFKPGYPVGRSSIQGSILKVQEGWIYLKSDDLIPIEIVDSKRSYVVERATLRELDKVEVVGQPLLVYLRSNLGVVAESEKIEQEQKEGGRSFTAYSRIHFPETIRRVLEPGVRVPPERLNEIVNLFNRCLEIEHFSVLSVMAQFFYLDDGTENPKTLAESLNLDHYFKINLDSAVAYRQWVQSLHSLGTVDPGGAKN